MKKKILLLAILLSVVLAGCTTNGFEVSKLKIENGVSVSFLKGKIKNTTNKDCNKTTLHVKLTSGSIKETQNVYIYDEIKSGETYELDELLYDEYDDYNAEITRIDCEQEN